LLTAGVASTVIYIIVATLAPQITAVFNSEGNAVLAEIAEFGLIIYFIGSIFASINALFSTYFASIEKPLPSQAITLLKGLVLIIPFIYLFSHFLGMTGVWLAYVITEAVVLVIAVTIYAIFRRRTKSAMLKEEQPDEAEKISF
jgi:Na+-driven multidrug efflux pump